MTCLVGIDPGTTTGIAVYYNGATVTLTLPSSAVLYYLEELNPLPSHIAIERFATAGKLSKYGLETIDLVGQVKGWAFARGVTVILFAPQSRRAWMGVDEPTMHQQDAKAHLLHLMEHQNVKVNSKRTEAETA